MEDKIKERLVNEDFSMPSALSYKLDDFVNELPDKKIYKIKRMLTITLICLAVLFTSSVGAYTSGYRVRDLYNLLGLYHSEREITGFVTP